MKVTPIFKKIDPKHPQLKEIITASIGNPTADKINTVLAAYEKSGKLIGAFISDQLVGCVGYNIGTGHLVIRHLSVMKDFQNKKIATNLIISWLLKIATNYQPLQILRLKAFMKNYYFNALKLTANLTQIDSNAFT